MFVKLVVALCIANSFVAQTAPADEVAPSVPTATVPATKGVGNYQENDDPCQQYSLCGSKGHQNWQTLLATVKSPDPVDKTDGPSKYVEFYNAMQVDREDSGQEVAQDLLTRGLSPLHEYQKWVCVPRQFSNGPDGEDEEEDEDWPYQNLFNAKDGVIIAAYNWRAEDTQKKLQWSELVFQTYLKTLEPGQSVSALQSVIQVDIVNPGTFRIVKQAYESEGIDPFNDNQWRKWTLRDQPYFFYGLLGTDNVKGTVWLLNDHAAELGKKVITQIWTRRDPTFDMWIDIGPYDPQRDEPVA